ncbi:MAG: hypothetical protein R2746_11845 [Acidimicrobiales bacterium]
MPIAKGEPWGEPSALPADGVVARTDAQARAAVERARRSGAPVPVLGLLGGDLCHTVGGRGDLGRLRTADAVTLPIDVGSVLLDGVQHWFVAHLVVRGRTWWRGRVIAVMNAQWIGSWDVAPRSHPNDGLLDVFDGDLSLDDRIKARSRLRTGTHVPHPGIRQQRTGAVQFELDRPATAWLDGERIGPVRRISARVEVDGARCVV